jgi:hypothetical protein
VTDAQGLPARGEHLEPGGCVQELRQVPGDPDHVLEVVQHEQRLPPAEPGRERRDGTVGGELPGAQRLGDHGQRAVR